MNNIFTVLDENENYVEEFTTREAAETFIEKKQEGGLFIIEKDWDTFQTEIKATNRDPFKVTLPDGTEVDAQAN